MYMRKLSRQVLCQFDAPVVTVQQGMLRGAKVEDCYIFRGVPYAAGGRFAPPTAPDKWEGVRPAENYGPAARTLYIPKMPDEDYVPRYYYPESETCQFLNIWTPTLDSDAKKPVMVWIHGNGWTSGSSMELYAADGENLAAHNGVVVVGLNHRLNVIGSTDLASVDEKYRSAGIAGLLDIAAALEWIRENIAAFGGDEDNITLMGHSGGAEKVLALMQCPRVDGLYHRVILSDMGSKPSGSGEQQRRDAQVYADLLLDRLSCTGHTTAQLDSMDWYDLASAALEAQWLFEKKQGRPYLFRPIADGQNYFGHPITAGLRDGAPNVPVLIGRSGEYTGDDIELIKLLSGRGSAGVWAWRFDLKAPFMSGADPWPGAHVAYAFRNAAYIPAQYEPGISEGMEDALSGVWTAFAGCGDPNSPALPRWDAVDGDNFTLMLFDEQCRSASAQDLTGCSASAPLHPLLEGVVPGVEPISGKED